jgi:5-hydroxyisourate hydrolase-like protein (transthyretin family)
MNILRLVVVGWLALGTIHPTGYAEAKKLLPWQREIVVADAAAMKPLPELATDLWKSTGGKEATVALSQENGPWEGRYLNFYIKVAHFNEGKYPMGWPAIGYFAKPAMDMSGWDAIQFWIRAETNLDRHMAIRFILHSDGKGRINQMIRPFRPGKWVQARFGLRELPHMDKVNLLHFFICENEYLHGDEMTFQIGGFELCNTKKEVTKLPPREAAVGLYVGERADKSDEVVMVQDAAAELPVLLVMETGQEAGLGTEDEVRYRFHEVFSGKESFVSQPLGKEVGKGSVGRVEQKIALEKVALAPGYYLVTADVLRGGRSVLGGRVGSDDLYVKAPGESMTYSVLSIRTGMALWVRDMLYGDLMCRTNIALPHVQDPLNKDTYLDFVQLFAHSTGKHTEGNEAGDAGLVFAAEAFRKSGDLVRAKFAEWLLKDSFEHMISKMQAADGATITWTNELIDNHCDVLVDKGGCSQRFGAYDSNQMGEWLRPMARAIVYFRTVPGEEATVKRLTTAGRKAADFIATHATAEVDGIPDVIQHVDLTAKPNGRVEQRVYYQEGRRCDVYMGRALAGLSYYAYAMQLVGEKVPERYWCVMDNSVAWSLKKMRPDTGWFDWQCEDVVEGGCHTFLGNIYVGEGLFGCYLADRQAGRKAQAAEAAKATLLAYRYVTDHCVIRGRRFMPPREFWVGPYLYWLFTEYQDAIGKEAVFQEWLDTLDRQWAVDQQWKDFTKRDAKGAYRTATNGALEISILGYLGLRQMQDLKKPFSYPSVP